MSNLKCMHLFFHFVNIWMRKKTGVSNENPWFFDFFHNLSICSIFATAAYTRIIFFTFIHLSLSSMLLLFFLFKFCCSFTVALSPWDTASGVWSRAPECVTCDLGFGLQRLLLRFVFIHMCVCVCVCLRLIFCFHFEKFSSSNSLHLMHNGVALWSVCLYIVCVYLCSFVHSTLVHHHKSRCYTLLC